MDDPTLVVRSPTYTYYQKYSKEIVGTKEIGNRGETKENLPPPSSLLPPVYHFGGEEIAEDPTTIMLIEWPEILGDRIQYTTKISIEVMENGDRKVIIETS